MASISVHPTAMRETLAVGENKQTIIHITNIGPSSSLAYTVEENVDWLSALPLSGQITVGDTVNSTLIFDASMLSAGEYTTELTIGDPHHGPILIPVVLVVVSVTGIKEEAETPEAFALGQNYPNPFNPQTSIQFYVPTQEYVSLKVFDMLGQQLAVLVDGVQSQGTYTVDWDASGFSSGTYFYRFQTQRFSSIKSMSLIK